MDTLRAEKRSMDVKAKRLRREGYVTGCIFGREIENSIPVKILKTDLERLLKNNHKGSQIMLDVEGTSYDVLIKEMDYNSLASRYDEIDFQALVSNEKVHSTAEVVLLNHDKVVGGVVELVLPEISYKALPAALTDKVEIDVAELKVGDTVKVKDLAIAKNPDIDLKTDPEAVVVTVMVVHNDVPEEDAAEADEKAAEK